MFNSKGRDDKKTLGNRAGSAPSIISSEVLVNGSFRSAGDVQIEGRIMGDIHCVSLVIGDCGQVVGNIFAEDVTIHGQVKGCICAQKVRLCSLSHVESDILHKTLLVEMGAFFEGSCRQSDNPLAEAPNKVSKFYSALETFAATLPLASASDVASISEAAADTNIAWKAI